MFGFEGTEYLARWLSWLERRPVTAEVVGSIPIRVAFALSVSEREPLAALSESEKSDFGFLPNYHKEDPL